MTTKTFALTRLLTTDYSHRLNLTRKQTNRSKFLSFKVQARLMPTHRAESASPACFLRHTPTLTTSFSRSDVPNDGHDTENIGSMARYFWRKATNWDNASWGVMDRTSSVRSSSRPKIPYFFFFIEVSQHHTEMSGRGGTLRIEEWNSVRSKALPRAHADCNDQTDFKGGRRNGELTRIISVCCSIDPSLIQ